MSVFSAEHKTKKGAAMFIICAYVLSKIDCRSRFLPAGGSVYYMEIFFVIMKYSGKANKRIKSKVQILKGA